MKISIVMGYLNRKEQLLFTLRTINDSKYKNKEVIIVDDGSNNENRLEDIVNNYNFSIKLIRIDPQNKKHINPCIAYNTGFKQADGDIVVIQNPECCHIGDVCTYVAENLKMNEYYTFTCANMRDSNSNNILRSRYNNGINSIRDYINGLNKQLLDKKLDHFLWYNHPTYRPFSYHFLSAIYKKNLDELGGFDERYAYGLALDDLEFINRIRVKYDVKIIDHINNPFAIHQWHPKSNIKYKRNSQLYVDHMKELGIKIIPCIEMQAQYIIKKKKTIDKKIIKNTVKKTTAKKTTVKNLLLKN